MNFYRLIYRLFKGSKRIILRPFWRLKTIFLFKANNVDFHTDFATNGIPKISVTNSGTFSIGKNFKMNNGYSANIIGRQQPSIFSVNSGILKIGDNVGLSSTAIICLNKVEIRDNVKIGGNVAIYDTDFHSLDPKVRQNQKDDFKNRKSLPIVISKNVFIGAHSTILKGITIGENSIIGACSVVAKNIPKNEIWGGNPAKFIKLIP